MKSPFLAITATVAALAIPLPLRAQFTPPEIAQRPAIEEFLLTAEMSRGATRRRRHQALAPLPQEGRPGAPGVLEESERRDVRL
jgi:hypothetical protein